MKKYGKLLPLFLAAPLLMSCGNGKVKKPEFADKGSEKTRAQFVEAYDDISSKGAMAKEDLLPSAVTSYKRSYKFVDEVLRANKVVESTKQTSSSEESRQIDMENVFTSFVSKESGTYETKDANGKSSYKSSGSKKQSLQEVKGSEKTYLVKADHNEKTFSLRSEVMESKTTKDALDSVVRSIVSGLSGEEFSDVMYRLHNPLIPDEAFKNYKLYQNEKVFTIEFEEKLENEEYKVDDKVISVENKVENEIWQVDMTDGKMAFKHYKHVTDKTEHKVAHEGHAQGDVESSETEEAEVASYEYSSSIKAKKVDISGYAALFEVK